MFDVIGTDTYLRALKRWPKADRDAAEKIPRQLAAQPFLGDPLGYPFLREKRVRERRVYYLVYEDLRLVLLVATSGKKDQQTTIAYLKSHLAEFREIAKEVIKRVA